MIGQTVSHYRILEKIGEGGMGVVYKAQDLRLDRLVALKFLPSHLQTGEETRRRFMHEAKAASALDHPNIITVHDIGETADGRMFIATAYYEGETLADRLSQGSMALGDVVDIFSQIADGLGMAHEKKIVHRDVKPANIFITRDNHVKIVDFGLAKLAGQTKVTRTGHTVGTLSYMSPEQARGEDVDHRSDIFSAGSVLYEMLTGKRPFPGDHEAAVMYAIVNQEPLPLAHHRSDLPAALQPVVAKMLAKDRDERYATMGEVGEGLAVLGIGPVPLNMRRVRPRARGKRLVGVVAIVTTVAAGFWLWTRFAPVSPRGVESLPKVPTEFVIAVAPFWGGDEEARHEGRVMQALVERRLRDLLGDERGVRIVAKTIEIAPRTAEEAQSLGKAVGASITLWGDVLALRGEVELQPYLTVVPSRVGGFAGRQREDPWGKPARSLVVDLAEPEQIKLRSLKADEISRLAALAGARFYGKRDPQKALAIIAGIAPPMAESEQLRGRILADDQRWEEARTAYESAAAMDPQSPWPLIGLGWVYQQAKQYETAISTFEKAVERDPKKALTCYYLGHAHMEVQDYGEAMRAFTRAEELDPRSAEPLLGIGRMYSEQGRIGDAITLYRRAADTDPTDPRPHVDLAGAYLQYFLNPKERVKRQIEEYERAIAIDPAYAEAIWRLAVCYRDERRYEDAVALFHRCLALEPFNIDVRVDLSRAHEAQGELDLAREELERAISLKPKDPWPHEALAYFHENRGDTSSAVEEYKRAIGLHTGAPAFSACVRLGGIYVSRGRLDEAEATFRRASLGGDDGFVSFFVGYQFLSRGRYERAIDVYSGVLADSPGWTDVYRYMGWAYEGLGRWQEAADTYARGLALSDTASVSATWAGRTRVWTGGEEPPTSTVVDSLAIVRDSFPYYLAMCRLGRTQDAVSRMEFLSDSLGGYLSRQDLEFDRKIVDFLAGRLDEKKLWKAAGAKDRAEENDRKIAARYYIGMAYLLGCPVELSGPAPDERRAREYLEQAVAIEEPGGSASAPEERDRASFELKRLRGR